LRSLGYTDDHIQAAGMATRARTGNLIDRFRDRLTIPLRDANGDLVGFTARSAPDANSRTPKYLNSPGSSIFTKSEIVYGISDLPDLIPAGYIPVVCEGALDAIAIDVAADASDGGFHGLATCGTAFTAAHARQIVAAEPMNICLAYDGDYAGREAAEHAWVKITEAGTHSITTAELPAGSDPASLNADNASDLVERLLAARDGALVVVDRRIAAAHIVDDLPRQYGLFHDIVEWAAELSAERRVDVAIHAARRLGIHPDDAAAEVTQNRPRFMADSPEAIVSHCDSLSSMLDSPSKTYDKHQPVSSERTIQPPAIAS